MLGNNLIELVYRNPLLASIRVGYDREQTAEFSTPPRLKLKHSYRRGC
jgi:hypothetical protein